MSVIWHDVECGAYTEDLPLWCSLADEQGDPVLDVGAGTGRVALELARRGHRVTALDHDPLLLEALAARAADLDVETVVADAREFELHDRFSLCVVPMQTVQLLGGGAGRTHFLRCARRHLLRGGVLAVAIAEALELFDGSDGVPLPLPDIIERDGLVYSSQPTAVRLEHDRYVLERRRETMAADGTQSLAADLISLDRLTVAELESEAAAVGLRCSGTAMIAATRDYVGSEVVILRA